jgi:hypothetical protein
LVVSVKAETESGDLPVEDLEEMLAWKAGVYQADHECLLITADPVAAV